MMKAKKHSRSFQGKRTQSKPGVFTVFSPESWSERRLKWYTADELIRRRRKMRRHLETIQNPVLRKKIRYELKTIKSILS